MEYKTVNLGKVTVMVGRTTAHGVTVVHELHCPRKGRAREMWYVDGPALLPLPPSERKHFRTVYTTQEEVSALAHKLKHHTR